MILSKTDKVEAGRVIDANSNRTPWMRNRMWKTSDEGTTYLESLARRVPRSTVTSNSSIILLDPTPPFLSCFFTPHSDFWILMDGPMTAGPRIDDHVADLAFLRPDGGATRLSDYRGPLLLVFLRHLH